MEKKGMTLNEYQEKAMTTCLDSSKNFNYMFCNLVGEIGEFASKIAKAIRKNWLWINHDSMQWIDLKNNQIPANLNDELKSEVGDCCWQLAGLCEVMGWTLEDVCQMNLDKLAARKAAGTINGSGDGISGNERKAEGKQ